MDVSDTFESSVVTGGRSISGLVVVIEGFPYRGPRRLRGYSVRIVSESGQEFYDTIDEAKDHVATISLFFNNLTKASVSKGAKLYLAD